ncbi:hypothetical protein CEUSTIGMA_g10575.t1 [Chlamydomonas eustigma]|uniref:Uncharacterized protein n=1 Tax=Chlamydomonas eustigma TaxID=1157962 RepID=A0A250XJP9_9CHLO|nr:hypothetical protein CEUSTIGMA_g10575.t1 [Chlamydomonas eustigma]|eukprot:GAX83149.1 hypothetical protein CEUSTIGMA_g10575.t1 [Chlamydomonas eustigma]
MVLKLVLQTNKVYYEPGELVYATLQIANELGSTAQASVKRLILHAGGHERIDPGWIGGIWKSECVPEASESRRLVRTLFKTETAVLVPELSSLSPGNPRQFCVRFRLPSPLPPSFRGTSIRFTYSVVACMEYVIQPDSGATSVSYETVASTALLILPPQPSSAASHTSSSTWISDPSTGHKMSSTLGNNHVTKSFSELIIRDSNAALAPVKGSGGTGRVGGGSNSGSGIALMTKRSSEQQESGNLNSIPISSGAADEAWEPPMLEYQPHMLNINMEYQEMALISSGEAPSSSYQESGLRAASCWTLTSHTWQCASNTSGVFPLQEGLKTPQVHHESLDRVVAESRMEAKKYLNGGSEHEGAPGPYSDGEAENRTGHHPESSEHRNGNLEVVGNGNVEVVGNVIHRQESPAGGGRIQSQSQSEALSTSFSPQQLTVQDVLPQFPRRSGAEVPASVQFLSRSNSGRQASSSAAAFSAIGKSSPVGRGLALLRSGSIMAIPLQHAFSRSFMLSAVSGPVLKVTLQAPLDGNLQPGATFGGLLEYCTSAASAVSKCHQLSIMLQTEEEVAAGYSCGSAAAKGKGQGRVLRTLYCEHQEISVDSLSSHFLFTLPATATSSFRTPMVSLRWLLHFELLVGPPVDYSTHDRVLRAIAPSLQQLMWCLPLIVMPPLAFSV